MDQAHGFTAQGGEVLQALGEQNRAQVADMPLPAVAALDHTVRRQRGENRLAPFRQGLVSQVEVGRVVEQLEYLIDAEVLRGQLLLEGHAVEHAPERPFLFRKLAQLLLVGTDADIFDAIELYRGMAGRLNLQNHHWLTVSGGKLEKTKVNFRCGFLQQPAFQLLLLIARDRGFEGGADHRMAGIVDAP